MTASLPRFRGGSHTNVDASRCHGCAHPARIHNAVGCVFGPCECVVTSAELTPDAPRLEIPDSVESTPAVTPPVAPPPAAEPALLDVRCACGHARASHAAWGSGVPCGSPTCRCREFTAPDPAEVDPAPDRRPSRALNLTGKAHAALMAPAGASLPRRIPARPAAHAPALVSAAVVGERDAVGEVAATDLEGPVAATVTPEPLDLEPFLSAAVYSYAAWYCDRCHQRRHDPGACPDCRRTLQPVYVAIIPRSAP